MTLGTYIAALTITLALSVPAEAKGERGYWFPKGDANIVCSYWTATLKVDPAYTPYARIAISHIQLAQWVLGFVSAYNRYVAKWDEDIGSGEEDMLAWVDLYCADHPGAPISDAAMRLIEERQRRRSDAR